MLFLARVSFAIAAIGAVVIIWGILISLAELAQLEITHLKGVNICSRRELVRHHLGSYILLGLEFLIAADVIRTLIRPSLNELAVLGSLVAIRTVLSVFLTRDIESHTCGQEGGSSGAGRKD